MGNKYQNAIINENHNIELSKKAIGEIFLKKKNAAETMANKLTKTTINFISLRVIK